MGDKVRAIILTQSKKVMKRNIGFYDNERSVDFIDYPIDASSIYNKMDRGLINSKFGLSDQEAIFFEGNPNPITTVEVDDKSKAIFDETLKINWDNQLSGAKRKKLFIFNWKIILITLIVLGIGASYVVYHYRLWEVITRF